MKIMAADIAPVLKCPCGCDTMIPNDQVLSASQTIHARIVQAQFEENRKKRKTKRQQKQER